MSPVKEEIESVTTESCDLCLWADQAWYHSLTGISDEWLRVSLPIQNIWLTQFSNMHIIEKFSDDVIGKIMQQLVLICYSHLDQIGFTHNSEATE